MVFVVGIGPGNKEYMLKIAEKTLINSDYVLGFERALKTIEDLDLNIVKINSLKETLDFIENNEGNISVIASGDPLFYGITEYLKKNTSKEIKVIPGISSFQYLSSKLLVSWNGAYLGSMHGREEDFINSVRENKKSFWLTDKKNTPSYLCKVLKDNNVNCKVTIGENLSYEDEIITIGKPEELLEKEFSNLSVMVVEVI